MSSVTHAGKLQLARSKPTKCCAISAHTSGINMSRNECKHLLHEAEPKINASTNGKVSVENVDPSIEFGLTFDRLALASGRHSTLGIAFRRNGAEALQKCHPRSPGEIGRWALAWNLSACLQPSTLARVWGRCMAGSSKRFNRHGWNDDLRSNVVTPPMPVETL